MLMPATADDLAAIIDQSKLGLGVTRQEMETFVADAVQHRFGWVCVQPNMVALARRIARTSRTKVASVISFPLGADTPEVKRAEARDAVERGADEIDMVVDVGAARMGDADAIEREVGAVLAVLPDGVLLKTIIEMPLLTAQQATVAALAAERGGAHIVKTSTGFKGLNIRATMADDVRLLRAILRPGTGIKAAGGISSWPLAAAVIEAGATRLGTSSGAAILEQFAAATRVMGAA